MSNNNDNILDTFVVDTTTAKVEIEANEPFLIEKKQGKKNSNGVYEVSYIYDESKLKYEDRRHRWA